MAVTQTTESAASRLARKLPPDPNAGSAARRLAAKLPPAPAQTNAIPEDGSGFVGEAAKGSAKAALNIAAGAASSGPSVIQYLGEAVAGANALPMQILSAGANAIGMPMLGDAYQRTAEAVASKGIDISRAVGRGVANAPIMSAGGMTLPMMAQAPRAIAQSKMLAPSERAAADLAQMNNGTNFLPQTSAGWGSLTGEQAPSLLLGLGTGVVGGPGVGVTVTGLAAGAQEYESTLAQLMQQYPGKSMDFYEGEAARRAIQSAAVESVTERLPMGEILEGKLAKMFMGKAMNQWPRWARVLMGQAAKGATSALSEGTEEVVSEGAGAVGDRLAGDPNAFQNLPNRMATSGLVGGAMGAGFGVLTPGGFGTVPPQTPPTDQMGGRGPTKVPTPGSENTARSSSLAVRRALAGRQAVTENQTGAKTGNWAEDESQASGNAHNSTNQTGEEDPSVVASPSDQSSSASRGSSTSRHPSAGGQQENQGQQTAGGSSPYAQSMQDTTALDEAAAMAEQRLNDRYRAAPVGSPSPADQSASSQTEQDAGADEMYNQAIDAIMQQRAERRAARQDTSVQDEAIANIMAQRKARREARAATNAAIPSTPTSERPASSPQAESRVATGTTLDAGTSPSPVLPGAQPPASSGPTASQTGPVVGGSTSASPQSTREPWQMTRGEWVGGGTVGRIRFGDVDREVVESPQFDTPEEAKAWAASRGIVNPQIQSSGKRGGPKLYKASGSTSVHRDAVEAAHAAGKPVPPEVLAEYGLKPNPSESPNSSNPPAKPDSSTVHKFSSTQLNLPESVASSVKAAAAKIPDSDLAEDGRESEPHITVKYGLKTDDAAAVRAALAGVGPIRVRLGKTSLFENEDADVVKVDVHGVQIRRVNKLIASAIENEDTHPKYMPHVTLAYVKKGRGKKYAGDATLEGQEVTIGELTFSDRNGVRTTIALKPQPQGQAAATTNKENANGEEEAPQAQVLNIDEDVFERLGREVDDRKKRMGEFIAANRGKPFEVHSTEYGATIAFTPSAKYPGEWQATWFSPRDGKPSGDTRYPTWDAAVAAENRFGQLKPETAKVIGTAAPAPAQGTGAVSAKPKPGDSAKSERQAEIDAIAPDSDLDATGTTTTIADIVNNIREGKRRYVTARDSQNKRLGASMLESVRKSVASGMERLREERAKWEARGRATIPQEQTDGTGGSSTGSVGTARVNGPGNRQGQQAQDAGDAAANEEGSAGSQGARGQVTGASDSQIRAARYAAAEAAKQQRKKDATAKGQATKAKYANNPPQFRASDISKRLIQKAQSYPDLILDEMVEWGEDGSILPISDISTTFVGKIPTELTHEFDAEPQIRSMLRVVPTAGRTVGGNGADWLSKLGVQKYADVLRAKFYRGEGKNRMGVDGALAKLKDFTGQDHGAKFLVWLHDQFKDAGANRPDWTVVKREELKDGAQFSINGVNFEVMPDDEGNMFLRERGDNFDAIESGAFFDFDAIDEIPIDAGTLGMRDDTGEVPDIAPAPEAEQEPQSDNDADAMLGRIKDQLGRGAGRQSPDIIRAFQELGTTLVPGVRLQDSEEVGRMYAMLDDGSVTLAEYTTYIEDLRKSGKVAKAEPEKPAPAKFSDSEGVFGQKTESITGAQRGMFGDISPEPTAEMQDRYPGIRRGETVAEYEKRMGTADTPDMFGGGTGGASPGTAFRTPPTINDRAAAALMDWSGRARKRFDDFMGAWKRGEVRMSGPPITPLIDLAAHVAFKALASGITSKSGRKLTAFIEGRMADIRAKWPDLNVTTATLRRQVRNMLAAANDDKEQIIPAYAAARERVERQRTRATGKESGKPAEVREAVASATAERPDIAAKIIDAVKRGLKQGRAEGLRTASDALKPLIRQARDAAKRARQIADIEARGASDKATNAAADQAATEKGIRAEAVRLVQETPIAGRGKYLRAVAGAKDMRDLAKILHRLRGDLAKETGRHYAVRAERLAKNLRTLNTDRREEARKLISDIREMWDKLRDKDTGTALREELAEKIRDSFERANTIFHEQKNADKVSILGRAIQAGEHRDEMVATLEKRPELAAPSNPNKKRDKGVIRRTLDKFLTFQSLMQALDQEFYGNGIFARVGRAMSSRHTAELAKVQEFTDRADKMARKYGYKGLGEFLAKSSGALGEASQKWINVSLGEFKRITLGNAMDIFARDPETREKMHRGQTFTFDAEGGSNPFTISDSKLAEIENALTPQEKGMAMEMNNLRSEMQFERMSDVYKMLTGNYLVRVPWHYPIRRAMKLSESPDITKGLGEWTIKRMEEAGYLKQRVGGNAPIVIGDFAMTQLRQVQMGEAFINRASIVKYIGSTVLHPDVRTAIVRRHGTKIMDRIQQTISEFSGNESPQQDKMMRRLLSNIARAQTQVNVGTWARNLSTAFNVPLAVVDGKLLGVRKTLRGVAGALKSPTKTMRILMKHSPDLRHRWSHAGASISLMHGNDVQASTDIADTAFGDASKATIRQIITALKAIKAGDFKNQTAEIARPWRQLLDAIKLGNVFDGFGAMVAYHAVRADAPASLSPGAADKWAARRAADIFSQTANTNDLLNSNEWQMDARRSAWLAGILAFTSDIAKKQNLLYLATKRGKRATAYATAAVTLGALWSTAVAAALAGALGDDEDKIVKRAQEGLAKEFASLLPGGTLLSGVAEAWFNPRGSAGILDTPVTALIKNVQTAIVKFQDAAGDGDEADAAEAAYRVMRILNDITGAPIGPTAGMVKRAIVNYGAE